MCAELDPQNSCKGGERSGPTVLSSTSCVLYCGLPTHPIHNIKLIKVLSAKKRKERIPEVRRQRGDKGPLSRRGMGGRCLWAGQDG